MVLPAIGASTLPGKRVDANLAGMTPRILRGTEDLTINRLCYSWERKAGEPHMLPSSAKLLIRCAVGICLGSAVWGQANLDVRTKPVEKTESRPRSNIRVDSTLVLIPVTVTDPLNRFVTGLEKENFKLTEDKLLQEITQFSSEDAPLSVCVVFDCSGSMG